jgi:hypothetical protein
MKEPASVAFTHEVEKSMLLNVDARLGAFGYFEA